MAALIALVRIFEDFFRFHIEESKPHRAIAHDAFEVPHSPASAVALLRVERYGDVPALPHAIHVWPAAISNPIAERPHTRELVELAARGRHTRCDCIRVIGNMNRGG